MYIWQERINQVLADEKAEELAAIMYYLAVSRPSIGRKRRDAIDLLLDEMTFVYKQVLERKKN